jgi:hypothetical protein
MQNPQQKHWRILSYSLATLLLGCFPHLVHVDIAQPMSLPVAVPEELKIGKVQVSGNFVQLTPEQASKIAAQIEHYQIFSHKAYLQGRSEGIIALKQEQALSEQRYQTMKRAVWYYSASSLALGVVTGFLLLSLAGEDNVQ